MHWPFHIHVDALAILPLSLRHWLFHLCGDALSLLFSSLMHWFFHLHNDAMAISSSWLASTTTALSLSTLCKLKPTLVEHIILYTYVELFLDRHIQFYASNSMTQRKQQYQPGWEVRHGDIILPKLFTTTLKSIFRRFTWKTLRKEGNYISRLSSATDVLMCMNIEHKLQQILQEMADDSDNQDTNMNNSKTKVMMDTAHQSVSAPLW